MCHRKFATTKSKHSVEYFGDYQCAKTAVCAECCWNTPCKKCKVYHEVAIAAYKTSYKKGGLKYYGS